MNAAKRIANIRFTGMVGFVPQSRLFFIGKTGGYTGENVQAGKTRL